MKDDDKRIDDIVRGALSSAMTPVMKKMGEQFDQFSDRLKHQAAINLDNHYKTTRVLQGLNNQVQDLWRTIKGSDPPPPLNGKPPPRPITPLDELAKSAHSKISQHDTEIDSVQGQLLSLAGTVAYLLELQKKQSEAMGIGVDKKPTFREVLIKMLGRPRDVVLLVTAIASLMGAIGGTYAAFTGKVPSPLPSQAIHAPHP